MKKLTFLLVFALFCAVNTLFAKTNYYEDNLFDSLEEGDKVALLMVHFGTSYSDTRSKTIDVLNNLAKERYAELEHRQAWTSRIIIRKMSGLGEQIDNPAEALQKLANEGFTHVIVQSSNIIEGVEMESLRRDVLSVRSLFKDIRVGQPLLYSKNDYEVVVKALRQKQPKGVSLLLVGHGTYTPSTAQYAMTQYVIDELGYDAMHVATIEGYPDFNSATLRLMNDRRKKDVLLMPFMFVSGQHSAKDIEGDWRVRLSKLGYNVTTRLEGLGELKEVQELFMEHIDFAIENQMYDIVEKKSNYAGKTKK
ncbi:MAG: sirohydrochlorin cobaltochelatase [Rikenellaceae bacterium]